MAKEKTDLDAMTKVDEGEPPFDEGKFDEPAESAALMGEDASEGFEAAAEAIGNIAARFEGLKLRLRKGSAGGLTLGIDLDLALEGAALGKGGRHTEAGAQPFVLDDADLTALLAETPQEAAGAAEAAPRPRLQRVSKQGLKLIARFEGMRLKLYNDPAGHCTIGVGHLVHRGRCHGREPASFKRGLTRQGALALLGSDLKKVEKAVRRLGVPLTQAQFDALVSFTFNVGAGWMKKSQLRKALLRRQYRDVPRAMSRWVYAGGKKLGGLVRRRIAEGRLFKHGKYT